MSFSPIYFSKLMITGPLNPSMPYQVLKELASEMDILVSTERLNTDVKYWAKIFKKLTKLKPVFIENLHSQPSRDNIIRIVNPFERNWDPNYLNAAFLFLTVYQNSLACDPSFSFSPNHFPLGLQTTQKPISLNSCMLYSMCKNRNLTVALTATCEEMAALIEIYDEQLEDRSSLQSGEQGEHGEREVHGEREGSTVKMPQLDVNSDHESFSTQIPDPDADPDADADPDLEPNMILSTLVVGDVGDMIFVSPIRKRCPDSDPSPIKSAMLPYHIYQEIEKIESEANLFQDINYLMRLVEPLDNNQAVVLGAMLYNKDFSKFQDPLREFRRFKIKLPTSHCDVQMKFVEEINPNFNDLLMYFNPYIPKNAYKSETLDHHIGLFVYSSLDYFGSNPFQILQSLHLEENFHLGFHPNIMNNETFVSIQNINELSNWDIICFGVRDETLLATSWTELKEIFSNMNMFVNPFEKKTVFSKEKIERLYRLGKWVITNCNAYGADPMFRHLFENISDETIQNIRDCMDVIDNLNFMHRQEFQGIQIIKEEFMKKSIKQKGIIFDGMEKLFEITMLMRGWDRKSSYPIHHAPQTAHPNDTEKWTLESIFELDQINEDCKNFIYKLPLFIWKNEFVQSVLEEQGLTIGDRIKIVKKGESDGVHSCIRMTSNVLGSSYSFYCKVFKIPEKFNISQLTYIQ
jgi:hypothetical protein